jgi:ribosomal protein L19
MFKIRKKYIKTFMSVNRTLKAARNKMVQEHGHAPLVHNLLENERQYAETRNTQKQINHFRVGDYIDVQSLVKKGEKIRTVSFKGHCIARVNKGLPVNDQIPGLGSSFKVLRLSGEQRTIKHFCIHGAMHKVEVITQNISRRVKRYDLVRNKKISKISLKRDFSKRKQNAIIAPTV